MARERAWGARSRPAPAAQTRRGGTLTSGVGAGPGRRRKPVAQYRGAACGWAGRCRAHGGLTAGSLDQSPGLRWSWTPVL